MHHFYIPVCLFTTEETYINLFIFPVVQYRETMDYIKLMLTIPISGALAYGVDYALHMPLLKPYRAPTGSYLYWVQLAGALTLVTGVPAVAIVNRYEDNVEAATKDCPTCHKLKIPRHADQCQFCKVIGPERMQARADRIAAK